MTTSIIFAASLIISASLVLMRALELRSGKSNLVLRNIAKLDSRASGLSAEAKFRCLQVIQSVRYMVTVRLQEAVRSWIDDVAGRLADEYHKKQRAILMGQKEIVTNGSASFYLKKIAEHKVSSEKGRIEDSL